MSSSAFVIPSEWVRAKVEFVNSWNSNHYNHTTVRYAIIDSDKTWPGSGWRGVAGAIIAAAKSKKGRTMINDAIARIETIGPAYLKARDDGLVDTISNNDLWHVAQLVAFYAGISYRIGLEWDDPRYSPTSNAYGILSSKFDGEVAVDEAELEAEAA
ncbi:hypothetical protein [Mesorhizobium sp.]|uniref:hypothetical protein n=1 Tax=Mesorhizobium sp. TaxID=1871066 RepID=UPI000FE9986F|nr:hypothetical protein [Mesorhizobium sp.]RWP37426.1 MAG: hypothetical protein EOR03_04975 [Mesorhizobium sp.]